MMDYLILNCIPLPPSSNSQYKLVKVRGRVFHAPSKELVQFKKDMEKYFLARSDEMKFAREHFSGRALNIHCDFGFERSRLITKKGNFKRIDVSNYLKALHDCIAKALLIDDCNFVYVSARKFAVPTQADERVTVCIQVDSFQDVERVENIHLVN